jgi:hypothetical protein
MPVIPCTWEAETRRVDVQSQPRQKFSENPFSTNISGMMMYGYKFSYTSGCRMIMV